MKLEGMEPVKVKDYQLISESDIKKRTEISEYLKTLGIYNSLYTNNSELYNLRYHDGIHKYTSDANEAEELAQSGKEIPKELLDRLAYYKPIVDSILFKG